MKFGDYRDSLVDYWPCACVKRDFNCNVSSIRMNHNSVAQCRDCKCERPPNEETNHHAPHPHANLEPHSANASNGTHEAAQFNSLVRITFTHYRNRLVDPDGLSVKACLDGLVLAGILRDDSASCIEEIRHRQIKSDDEKTIVEIEEVT